MALFPVSGGCHCGAVRFEADVLEEVIVWLCNCRLILTTYFYAFYTK